MARTRKPTPISLVTDPKPAAAASPAAGNGSTASPLANPEEYIRRRAYELYLERGGQEGFAEEDWLRAEAELRRQNKQRSA